MNAFLAILGESVRLLRARKLFWISFSISILVALVYLCIGFDEKGVTLGFGLWKLNDGYLTKGSPAAEFFYTQLFSSWILAIWLTWVVNILALISCAPIFPEFMLEGAAGVTLSKPVSRWALFFYKYAGGLLFAMLQILPFALLVTVAIRWRLGYWCPSILWSVPLVTLVFSYLFAIQTLIGVKTRSVMFSILGTLLFWFMATLGNGFEGLTYKVMKDNESPFSPMQPMTAESRATWETWDRVAKVTSAMLPKTAETTAVLERLVKLQSGKSILATAAEKNRRQAESADMISRHSISYVILTSLGFEAVLLAWAGWMFTRRDF